jgi:uncharacterized membrane protein YkvA (DUF1232 family)
MKIDKDYVENKAKDINENDIKKLEKKKSKLRKILNLAAFSNQKEKAKLLLELVLEYKKGHYKAIPWRTIAAITFTLLYIINPLDIVPDILPFIGFIDDISVFLALSKLVEKDLELYTEWKSTRVGDFSDLS